MTNNPTPAEIQAQNDLLLQVANISYENRFEEAERRGKRDAATGRFLEHTDYGGDTEVLVSFTTEAVLNKMESFKANAPKYQDMDFITIIIPGNRDLTFHGPVTDFYQWRFPKEYAAYKAGKEAVLHGTPLSNWLELSPSQVKELEFYGIKTVEQIANLSDSNSGALRSFHVMKDKARRFLETAGEDKKASILNMKLQEQENKHKSEMDALTEKLNNLMAMVAADKEERASAKTAKKSAT